MAYKPNVYVLGGKPDLILTTEDINGNAIIPLEARLTVKDPSGDFLTVSGADMTAVTSGYLFYRYHPQEVGWYEYEGWVRDANGNEDASTRGFEVIDRVY
jgi:hypothetical protein